MEAVHQGRDALGVEYEHRWAHLARANLDHAHNQGATGTGEVVVGDARHLADLIDPNLCGRVALVVTSPPYGAHTHGHVRTSRNSRRGGVHKWDHRYSRDPSNLAHRNLAELLGGLTAVLTGCYLLLRPGGIAVITARPYRLHGVLVDLPAQVLHDASNAGLEPFDRHVALLCGLRGDHLVPRGSFFAMHEARKNRARGLPAHVIAHEDVLILRKLDQRSNRAATSARDDPVLRTDRDTPDQLEEWAA